MKKTLLLTIFVVIIFTLITTSVSAVAFPDPLKGAGFGQIFSKIFEYAIWFGAVILTVLVVWSAYALMFSKGDPGEIKKAKAILLYGVIGYVILLFAKAIQLVILNVLGASVS